MEYQSWLNTNFISTDHSPFIFQWNEDILTGEPAIFGVRYGNIVIANFFNIYFKSSSNMNVSIGKIKLNDTSKNISNPTPFIFSTYKFAEKTPMFGTLDLSGDAVIASEDCSTEVEYRGQIIFTIMRK